MRSTGWYDPFAGQISSRIEKSCRMPEWPLALNPLTADFSDTLLRFGRKEAMESLSAQPRQQEPIWPHHPMFVRVQTVAISRPSDASTFKIHMANQKNLAHKSQEQQEIGVTLLKSMIREATSLMISTKLHLLFPFRLSSLSTKPLQL